jgi:hypothetical protein
MPVFKMISRACLAIAAVSIAGVAALPAHAQDAGTTFFVTSTGIGNGGNLGGLAGADNYCQTLAQAAGAGAKTWRAYLSTQAAAGKAAENARDRIGKGPWQNAKGIVVARDIAELHGTNNITKQNALSEKGDVINGRGDTPGAAMVGHSDRIGLRDDDASKSWNSSHPSRGPDGGCSQNDLKSTGGDGLMYCFAAN